MEKVKERIIEYLAVAKQVGEIRGPIICLVVPQASARLPCKISRGGAWEKIYSFESGGVRDEAEIRGHRRTYIGAMPGKIIQSLRNQKAPTL